MNRIRDLFNITYPIIQGGMIWCSGYRLAGAVSDSGGLGLIGAGSMKPDILTYHLEKIKEVTDKPWGVNLPIFGKYAVEQKDIILKHQPSAVFTSAGSPKRFVKEFKDRGILVAHVVSSPEHALKSQQAGVDAVVAEGFEAGGHNGADEITTMVLIPAVKRSIDIPLIAAGGISTGAQMAAAFALGADGVQIGTRFAATIESSAHENFKQQIVRANTDSTMLSLKKVIPVRIFKNAFFQQIKELEDRGASVQELVDALGKGRARQGIFEGDLETGEIEFGQTASEVFDVPHASDIVERLVREYRKTINSFPEY